MPIRSEVSHGLIYAGDTPLACSIQVEQTGPMQLTVRAGSFTTTGEARIQGYNSAIHDALLAERKAERLADGRVRAWKRDRNDVIIDKAQTFVLVGDRVFDLTADPLQVKEYSLELGVDSLGAVDVQLREQSQRAQSGWRKIHTLVFTFRVPPSTTDLAGLDIYVLTVKPGFPPGTTASDWTFQAGSS